MGKKKGIEPTQKKTQKIQKAEKKDNKVSKEKEEKKEKKAKGKPIGKQPIKKSKNKNQESQESSSFNVNENDGYYSSQQPEGTQIKKGRPKRYESIDVLSDPAASIQMIILEYLDSVGLKHGLVFRQQERKKLINQKFTDQIVWNPQHRWSQQKQKDKVLNNTKLMNCVQKAQQDVRFQPVLSDYDFIDWFVNIGDIAAQQCTGQIYNLIAEVFQSILGYQNEQKQVKRAQKLLENSKILSTNFTNIRNVAYWLKLQKDQIKIKQKFIAMFKKFIEQLTRLMINEQKEIKQFIKQQNEMKYQLNKIINEK